MNNLQFLCLFLMLHALYVEQSVPAFAFCEILVATIIFLYNQWKGI